MKTNKNKNLGFPNKVKGTIQIMFHATVIEAYSHRLDEMTSDEYMNQDEFEGRHIASFSFKHTTEEDKMNDQMFFDEVTKQTSDLVRSHIADETREFRGVTIVYQFNTRNTFLFRWLGAIENGQFRFEMK